MTIDLEAIKARLAAATPGPWSRFEDVRADGQRVWRIGAARLNADVAWTPNYGDADADLIVHAPEDLTALVAENKRLRAVAEAARSVDVLLPSPSNIPTKTPELLASAIARLGMALDAYDALDAALDAWRGGEG